MCSIILIAKFSLGFDFPSIGDDLPSTTTPTACPSLPPVSLLCCWADHSGTSCLGWLVGQAGMEQWCGVWAGQATLPMIPQRWSLHWLHAPLVPHSLGWSFVGHSSAVDTFLLTLAFTLPGLPCPRRHSRRCCDIHSVSQRPGIAFGGWWAIVILNLFIAPILPSLVLWCSCGSCGGTSVALEQRPHVATC